MPELSVIVPVYRKEQYIEKCIASILAQTLSDLELILVDDGSPDRCGEICDEYAARDSRITVIHQTNQGVSAARNAGLQIASGNYLGFIDADDWASPEMFETLVQTAASAEADIAACAIAVWSEDGVLLRQILDSERVYSHSQMLEELFSSPDQLGGCCYNKVFLRSTVGHVRFPVGVTMCEDRIYLLSCYAASQKCVKISSALSQVVESANSATRGQSVTPYFAILASGKRMIQLADRISGQLKPFAVNRYLDDSVRYLRLIKKHAQTSGEAWKRRSIPHWLSAVGWALRAYLFRLLPRNRLRGYLWGLLHI